MLDLVATVILMERTRNYNQNTKTRPTEQTLYNHEIGSRTLQTQGYIQTQTNESKQEAGVKN